ncbi:helix-turn-helix transcriptional regulator [Variovorax sp. UC74_104]|uniref:helix-turn-helix transcriptional regulator n=1 Tax=Variovorax sp. UC74_104 TaxID=3374555 RepID=UPI003756A530
MTASKANQPADRAVDIAAHPAALLAFPAVKALTTLSRSELYRRLAAGTFPAPVKLGARAVRWRAGDVATYLESLR